MTMNSDKCRVLVVDNEKDVRHTVAGALRDDGHVVEMAGDESETMRLLQGQAYHFLVIDINLLGDEDEKGLELAKSIRNQGISSKIIFITGHGVKGSHFRPAKEYGVIDYVEKDGDWVEDLLEIIVDKFRLYDVFLCHNSLDKPAVKRIGNELKWRGLRPWLDEWDLQPGLPWQAHVESQIADIKSAAVFVGKKGIGPWQNLEIRALLNQFVKRNCPVIPVMLENASQKPDLPLFLQEMTWIDFRKDTPDPIKQLIWGITGLK